MRVIIACAAHCRGCEDSGCVVGKPSLTRLGKGCPLFGRSSRGTTIKLRNGPLRRVADQHENLTLRRVTLQLQLRLRGIDPVRRTSITSGLLILVFATSAFGCATGWSSKPGIFCPRPSTRQVCVRKNPGTTVARGSACSHILKSLPGRCSLRSLAQFQFAELHRFEIPSPLRHAGGKVSLPFNSVIIVSSIGSPETDRGPPRS